LKYPAGGKSGNWTHEQIAALDQPIAGAPDMEVKNGKKQVKSSRCTL